MQNATCRGGCDDARGSIEIAMAALQGSKIFVLKGTLGRAKLNATPSEKQTCFLEGPLLLG